MSKSQPLVSVLLPSRGRPKQLRRAVHSCFSTCGDPSQVEVILRLDLDDPDLKTILRNGFDYPKNIKLLVKSRLRGYMDLYAFTNECAVISTGKWLFPFNDDAWFGSNNWLKTLPSPNGKMVVYPRVDRPIERTHPRYVDFAKGPRFDFPIISRSLYNALGVYCPVLVYDWFWFEAWHKYPALDGRIIPELLVWHEYLQQPEGVNEFSIVGDKKIEEYLLPQNRKLIDDALERIGASL